MTAHEAQRLRLQRHHVRMLTRDWDEVDDLLRLIEDQLRSDGRVNDTAVSVSDT